MPAAPSFDLKVIKSFAAGAFISKFSGPMAVDFPKVLEIVFVIPKLLKSSVAGPEGTAPDTILLNVIFLIVKASTETVLGLIVISISETPVTGNEALVSKKAPIDTPDVEDVSDFVPFNVMVRITVPTEFLKTIFVFVV
ncbi:MAG: hypothetical protein R6V72_01205 [Cyclobacterium sp.]|uniref:hypothetical protein n=2 Tax=unclassified Cyclobacterium TaxID=2615055 RepID=UPI00397058F4